MAFLRTRTVKGKTYSYWEERYRGEDGKVKSRHLGKRLLTAPVAPEDQGWAYIERLMEKYPGDPFVSKASPSATSVEKPVAEISSVDSGSLSALPDAQGQLDGQSPDDAAETNISP